MSGAERIAEAFAGARADGRCAALMPYMMGGFPDLERSRRVADAYVQGGADLVELGVPFSDPLADGPVIHAAATEALARGIRLAQVLELCTQLSQHLPVVLMCYSNPIVMRGAERFLDTLAAAGASGLIVPDLPHEEAAELLERCEERGLALVPLVAPNTPPHRLADIAARARGFLYAVALTGTTGERSSLAEQLPALLSRLDGNVGVPVAAGFGIATPDQALAAARAGADGVIVGSRLVRAAQEAGPGGEGVRELVAQFAAALQQRLG